MKKFLLVASALAAVVAAPAIAQETQHQHDSGQKSGMQMEHNGGMQQHQQAMQEMQDLRQRAKAATDPAERQRLMAEHRKKMKEQMAQMMSGENAEMMKDRKSVV